jgi:hypothetical protein
MAQYAVGESLAVEPLSIASEWFTKNYPDLTPSQMAEYYRSMRLPLEAMAHEHAGYDGFYQQMTGDGRPAKKSEKAKLAQAAEMTGPQRFHDIMPLMALFVVVCLAVVGGVLVIG